MPTTPLSSTLIAGLKGKTAWRFQGELGAIFTPRFFCCDSPNELGITEGKTPVAVLDVTPNPVFAGDTVTYDGTDSYDPDGSITSYAFTFESQTPSSGTVSSGTFAAGTVPGTFTVELTVTDGTGISSSPARTELIIKEVTFAGYAATSSGVFYGETSSPPSWATKFSTLAGDDAIVNDVKIDPATRHLPQAQQTVWVATNGGIHVSNDGGATATEKNPGTISNQWSDGTAPTVANLNFTQLHFGGSALFVSAVWPNSDVYRSWILYTTDHAAMRSDTSGSVTWTELTTGWDD